MLGSWGLNPATRFRCGWIGDMAFGVWSLEFGVWSLAFGVWRLEFGVWSLEFGVRRLEFGVWSSAFGVRRLEFSAPARRQEKCPQPKVYRFPDCAAKRRTPNAKLQRELRQTPNCQTPTPNSELRTPNSELPRRFRLRCEAVATYYFSSCS